MNTTRCLLLSCLVVVLLAGTASATPFEVSTSVDAYMSAWGNNVETFSFDLIAGGIIDEGDTINYAELTLSFSDDGDILPPWLEVGQIDLDQGSSLLAEVDTDDYTFDVALDLLDDYVLDVTVMARWGDFYLG